MSSKYDKITTPAELVSEIRFHGMSTEQEDICRIQDIFGNAPIEELVRLANDIGRNNENGEPDPKGSWSSNRPATQSTFYMILSQIWNWEEVTRFWNQHTNPQTKELQELRSANKELMTRLEKLLANQKVNDEVLSRLERQLIDTHNRAEEAEAEVIQLKAKLYDLLVEKKGDELR